MKSSLFKCFLFVCSLSIFGLMACDQETPETQDTMCTVTYKSQYGTPPAAITVAKNTILTTEDLPELEAEGENKFKYKFHGWYDGETLAVAGTYKVTENVVLKADWLERPLFTVSYETQYGTAPDAIQVYEDSLLTAEQLPVIYADGENKYRYDFDGWYDGETRAVADEYKVSKGVKLIAKWKERPLVTLSYSSEYGTAPASIQVYQGTVLNKDQLPKIEVAGYDFIGWKDGDSFALYDLYKVNKDVTLKAEFGEQLVIDGVAYANTSEVFVEGKTFTGTSNKDSDGNEINYEGSFPEGASVTINSYRIGRFEVTQELYATVMEGCVIFNDGEGPEEGHPVVTNPSWCVEQYKEKFGLENYGIQKYRPVDEVTWYDAILFCNKLSEKLGLTRAYDIKIRSVVTWYKEDLSEGTDGYHIEKADVTPIDGANGYRLPYETEWEFAARGGNPDSVEWNYLFAGSPCEEGIFYYDEVNFGMDGYGWYAYNNITGISSEENVTWDPVTKANKPEGWGSHQVGLLKPNSLGIFDMSGNVMEWCYDEVEKTEKDPNDETRTITTKKRVERGGAWYFGAKEASVSNRDMAGPAAYRYNDLGIRLVRTCSE